MQVTDYQCFRVAHCPHLHSNRGSTFFYKIGNHLPGYMPTQTIILTETSAYKLWLKINEIFSHTLPRGQHCHSAGSCWLQQDGVLSCLPGTGLWMFCRYLSLQQAIQAPSKLHSTPHVPISKPLDGWMRSLIHLQHWTKETFVTAAVQ